MMTSASAPGGVKANVKAEPPTPPIPAAADRLETLLAEPYATLGDAVRAPNDRRAAIVACVSEMEKRNPTPAPARSATQTGDWTLRYTTSAGTMGSIAAWETVAGAVTDVAQRVDAVSDGDVVNVQNEVSVSLRSRADAVGLPLPPLALLGVDDDDVLTLRITQRFESRTQSRGRLSTKLLTSDVELRSRRKKGGGTKGAGGSSERTLGSFRQPGSSGTTAPCRCTGGDRSPVKWAPCFVYHVLRNSVFFLYVHSQTAKRSSGYGVCFAIWLFVSLWITICM